MKSEWRGTVLIVAVLAFSGWMATIGQKELATLAISCLFFFAWFKG